MVKRKRISLSLRLQPYSGTLLAEVASWLNSLERDEARRMVEAALIMAYLPYARADSGATPDEIERCCWETQDLLDKHGFNFRQALQVAQPQWLPQMGHQTIVNPNPTTTVVSSEPAPLPENEKVDSPVSQIKGKGSYRDVDALWGDD